MIIGNVDITKVDSTAQYPLGSEFPIGGDKVAMYLKYDDGAGNIVGIKGMATVQMGIATGSTGSAAMNTVTCDYGTAGSAQVFGGLVLADTITNGKFGWFQVSGKTHVPIWTDNAVNSAEYLVLDIAGATHDGAWDTMDDGEEEQVCADALADAEITAVMIELATVTTNFAVGGTVTGGTSTKTGTVKTIFKDGTTQKAVELTGTSLTFSASETVTSNGGAAATLGDYLYYRIQAGNARIHRWR